MLTATISGTGAASDIIAAASGVAIRLFKIEVTLDAAGTLTIHDGTAAAATRLVYGDFAANGGVVLDFGDGGKMLTRGNALKLTTSAGTAHGVVYYTNS